MRVLTYPIACEECFFAFKGVIEIRLMREGEEHYLDVWQKANLDWGICPRCKKIACLASCWDKESGFCKSCAPYASATAAAAATAVASVTAKQTDVCPECRKELTGAIEVKEIEMLGVPVISLEETPDRNWIACDACNTVVCKSCCLSPERGYCNACLMRLQKYTELDKSAEFYAPVQQQKQRAATAQQNTLGGQVK